MNTIIRHRAKNNHGFRWIASLTCAALLIAAGAVIAYQRYGSSCSQTPISLTIVASPDQVGVMGRMAADWSAANTEMDGQCLGEIAVRPMAPAAVATALGSGWDVGRDGPRPDVWAPDSSLWLLAATAEAKAVLPASAPSIATSPVIMAMQRPMAEAFGWPAKPLGWNDLLQGFIGGQTWARFGHAEWGPMRVGLPDPTFSTDGLAAVLSALDLNNDNRMSDEEILGGVTFSQLVTSVAPDAGSLLAQNLLDQPGAVPVSEQQLATFLAAHPQSTMVPVYPSDGVAYADYPYVVLRAPWVEGTRSKMAAAFLDYLRGEQGVRVYGEAGFRDVNHVLPANPVVTGQRGFKAEKSSIVRKPTPESMGQMLGMWAVLQRPNNVLVALDTSGSMNAIVPGTAQRRLEMLQRAAIQGISLLNNQSTIGLWQFATELTPTADYRELVPVGKAGEMLGPYTRRQAMAGAIAGLQADGDTGLYDTILAAYLSMSESWQAKAQNVLVVITDGKNEDKAGISLEQLTERLKAAVRPDRPLTVIGIAVGEAADADTLDAITKITGGRTFVARDDATAIQQVVLAFAGRIG